MERTAHPSKNQLTPFASPAEQRSGMNVVATRSSTNASPHRVLPLERRGTTTPGRGRELARVGHRRRCPAPHDSAWLRTLGAPITSVRQWWCGLGAE